jgi:chlorite dismutase
MPHVHHIPRRQHRRLASHVGFASRGRVAAFRALPLDHSCRGNRAADDPIKNVMAAAGVAGHVRYVERDEKTTLSTVQAALGRAQATQAALIPIRKSSAWWELTQEERRQIFEDKSHHIAASLKYLPAIARQLYQCRDLGEPFDFLAWFEYAPEHAQSFEDLVGALRSTEEWTYVEREVDVRLVRSA